MGQNHPASRYQTLDFNPGLLAPELSSLIPKPYVLMTLVVQLYLPYPRNVYVTLCHLLRIRRPFDFAEYTTEILLVWVAVAPSVPLIDTPIVSKLPSEDLACTSE